MMDPLIGESGSSRATSKKSKKSTKDKKKSKKKSKKDAQNAGQPSGPAVSSSERRSSRSRVADEERDEGSSRRESGGGGSGVGKAASYAVGATHAIDAGLGLALLIYGGMVHVGSVTAAAVCYGLVLLLGAVAGAVGYYSGACNRRGIAVSSGAGFLASLLDLGAFIAVLAGWDGFIKFLNDNHEALMLTEAGVKTIQGLKWLFAFLFLILGGLEVQRGIAMWRMKDTMSDGRVAPNSRSGGSSSWCPSWLTFKKKKKTDDFVVFDDNASMESSLLWSKNGSQPTSDDYLEFVPEHERGLEEYHARTALPVPPEDRVDY